MGQITVIKRNGTKYDLFRRDPICTVTQATQNFTLMGDDNIQLAIKSATLMDFSIGDKIFVSGDEYSIRTKATREIVSEGLYSYDVMFYGVMYELMKSQYRNTDASGKSSKSSFDLTYSLADMIKVLIYNVNRDYPGLWVFDADSCPDTEPITIQFSKQNCLQVLQSSCKAFGYEFRIDQEDGVRIIRIGKFGTIVTPPGGNEFFEWGKGNGLYKLKEQKVDDKSIITRLWIDGGSKNIRSEYRDFSDRLQIPYPKRLNQREHVLSDGTVIPAMSEMIGISDDSKRYIEDVDLKNQLGSIEDTETYDDIYPHRTGVVSSLGSDIYSFVDNTMDFDLGEKDADGTKYLINGVTAKITFITGKMAGQQFELKETGGYNHASKTFTIIKYTDERGSEFPSKDSEAFRIAVGDKYKITDINLPKSYEDNAEEDLWYAGYDDFRDRKQVRAQYTLTFDRSYFINALPDDSETSVFKCGDYVPVRDERFNLEKNIRIQKITRNLLVDHDYVITLSDTTTISIQTQTVLDVLEHNIIIDNNRLRDLNKARRGWRTTEELRNMVYDTDGYFDTENIKPNSIDTNMLTVGSKSQQFVLIDTVLQANVNGLPNRFDATEGILAHLTIDEKEVKRWNMAAASVILAESGGYYVFAKCSKTSGNGIYYITQEQLKVEPVSDPNNYYFQVGIIGSLQPDDNFRDFITTHGFTRINGNTVTTGKIVTSDGECYLDLDGNKFRMGDATSSIDWNVTRKNGITLRNVQLISESGDTSDIGVFRGTYNGSYVYYRGDEVLFASNGETCTYRYINNTPAMGKNPADSTYWAVVAKGSTGATGEAGLSIFYTYNDSQDKPATPTGNGSTGGWHTYSTEAVIWMSVKTAKTISEGSWGTPYRVRGADGTSVTILGSKNSVSELPLTGNHPGDAYMIAGNLYIWDGSSWQNMGRIKGDDGSSSFLHLKYSNDGGITFTAGNGETPGRYMGVLVDQNNADSNIPGDYKWNDTQGVDGTPGEPGKDGQTSYLHIKYSDNGGLSFTSNNGEDPGDYIGQYTDFEKKDSDNPEDYTWSRTKGESGTSGSDSNAGEFFEYRYAKNGSTTIPPSIDLNAADPSGWSTVMPTPGTLEYVWCTIAKKSLIVDKQKVYIPVNASDSSSVKDISGNNYNGSLSNGGSVVADGSRYVMNLSKNGECSIPYDLPFGSSFTLCFWMKTNQQQIKWMLNGYSGREYVEKTLSLSANTWTHLAFRFNDRTVSVFVNGSLIHSGSVNTKVDGFALYDDNMFGSSVYFDDVRILDGALSIDDINKIKTGDADKLIQKWSTPVRVNPYDGKDGAKGDKGDPGAKGEKGESPVLVFRGIYDGTKTYYGTNTRLDAVKYNGIYYIARIDGGSFSGNAPTDTSKWNTFGAQFETIATNLLLAEGANIGDWFMSGGKIISTLSGDNKITLDASMARIIVESTYSGGDYSMLYGLGSKISIDANNGIVKVEAKNRPSYSTGTAYMSPTGIFANLAGTDALPSSSGYTHRGAIVGLGFANINYNWDFGSPDTVISGVYGRASNSGNAPAYGGYFQDLMASGLILNKKYISDSSGTTYLYGSESFILGLTNSGVTRNVYLPSDGFEGKIIFAKQVGQGAIRFYPRSGQYIHDDSSQNDYYDIPEGWLGIFVFTKFYLNGVAREVWTVSMCKFR